MFKTIFTDIQKNNPEAYMIGIWGKDGLELEKMAFVPSGIDVDLLGAELAEVVGKLDNLEMSSADINIEYVSGKFKIFVYSLKAGYFLLLVTSQSLISGKLKFFLDLKKSSILSLL